MSAAGRTALELRNITRSFGTLRALDDVSLAVRPGTVHAVLGENGAGKSTLMHVAYGMIRPDSGIIEVAGVARSLTSPLDAIAAGIGMVHQHFTLVPSMTVAENVALGGTGRLRMAMQRERVRELAGRTGFALDPDALVETLPVGAQQRVEIAKALARDASVLILDEPTAVLAPAEVDDLLRWLRVFVDAGNAAVLITHKLREALAVADDVTVLRQGRTIYAGPASTSSMAQLAHAMIGDANAAVAHTRRSSTARAGVVFDARAISVLAHGRGVRDATFVIREGEIVGIAAVEGAGHRELLRALAGRLPIAGGSLVHPADTGFVPEDRHADAVLLDRPLAENVALRGAGVRRGGIAWSAMRSRTAQLVQRFDVRAASVGSTLRTLSGGNQQKLVLARELDAEGKRADAIVVENPTRGLDIRATADVHRRLREAADDGTAIVVYSSDLDEVLTLASRVIVVHAGTVREVPVDRDAVGRAMLGAS